MMMSLSLIHIYQGEKVMAVKFGPGGNSLSFGKRKFPDELPSYLASMGLDVYKRQGEICQACMHA